MRVLLDERYAPVTSNVVFLKHDTSEAPADLTRRLITEHRFTGEPEVTPAPGDLETKIQQLITPGLSDHHNRFLAIPVGEWVALFSNDTGGGYSSMYPLLESSNELSEAKISVRHNPHVSAKRNAPREDRWGSLEFYYYLPETRTAQSILRSVDITLYDEGWEVRESGDRLPGECDEQWKKRQKKDRFTSETIHQVCLNFGIDVYNPDTYAADGVILQYGGPSRNDMEPGYLTLDEVQTRSHIVPGVASKIPEGKPRPQPITGPPIPKPLIPIQPPEAFDRICETTEPGAHLEPWTATVDGEAITCWAAWTDLPSSDHPAAANGQSPILASPPFRLKPGTCRENLFAQDSLISDYTNKNHGDQTYRNYRISDSKEDLQQTLSEWMIELTAQRDRIRRTHLAEVPHRFMRFVRVMHEIKEFPWTTYSRDKEQEFATEYNLNLADDVSQRGLWEDGQYWVLRHECPTGCGADLFIDLERPDPLEMRYKIAPSTIEPWWTDDTPDQVDDTYQTGWFAPEVFAQLPEGPEPGKHVESWADVIDGTPVSGVAGWTDRPSPDCPACEAQPDCWPVILPKPPFTIAPGTEPDDIFSPENLVTEFTCPECGENRYENCQIFEDQDCADEELELFMEELTEARTVIRNDKLLSVAKQFFEFLKSVEGQSPAVPVVQDSTCVAAAEAVGLELAESVDGEGLWFDSENWTLTVACPTGSGAQLHIDTYRPGALVPDYKIKPTE